MKGLVGHSLGYGSSQQGIVDKYAHGHQSFKFPAFRSCDSEMAKYMQPLLFKHHYKRMNGLLVFLFLLFLTLLFLVFLFPVAQLHSFTPVSTCFVCFLQSSFFFRPLATVATISFSRKHAFNPKLL